MPACDNRTFPSAAKSRPPRNFPRFCRDKPARVICDVPERMCLYDHIRPKLPGASEHLRVDDDGKPYILARCPVHDDRKPSLKISQGKEKRLVWICYANCNERKIRHAMLALGVHPGCLPRSAPDLRDLEEQLRSLLTSDAGHAAVRIRALALLDAPGGRLPRGAALDALAVAAGVSRAEAYRALAAPMQATTK